MRYIIDRKTNEHERYDGQNYDATKYRIVEADSDGWIKHEGMECPLPEDARCEVKFGNGTIIIWDSAGRCWWHNTALKAYRPILAERVQEPEPAAELTTNTIDLLGTLARAHEHAQQIPDLEAELREVLAGMGYDLVSRSPFVEPEDYAAAIAEREPSVETPQDMSDWRTWREGDYVLDYSSPWPVVSITKIEKSEDKSSRPVQLASPCGDLYSPDIKDLRFYSRPAKGGK